MSKTPIFCLSSSILHKTLSSFQIITWPLLSSSKFIILPAVFSSLSSVSTRICLSAGGMNQWMIIFPKFNFQRCPIYRIYMVDLWSHSFSILAHSSHIFSFSIKQFACQANLTKANNNEHQTVFQRPSNWEEHFLHVEKEQP